ncbi:MAG TPA: SDR family oxidoreductase [Acidimicrobiia bacterium]|nr:SDR family oxidoreductase [Acidimicrobiia bacterium]
MSDITFEGRVAIVTGAGGGLGREHALLLAARGAHVVVNDLGGSVDGQGASSGPAQQVVDEITAAGGVAVVDTNSVSSEEGGLAIVQTALDAFSRVDIIVNNAGILRDKSFGSMTPDMWDAVINVHLRGAYCVSRAAWPHLREQNYGRIVSTSSAAGIFGNFGQANYGAAKMGLVGLTRVLAQEGARNNIKVNAIAPVARTRMTEDLLGPLADKLDPSLVSPLVAYLASEDCPLSGEVFSAGGGRVARIFVAEALGYFDPVLTPETVRDHVDVITSEEGYTVPRHAGDEIKLMLRTMSAVTEQRS